MANVVEFIHVCDSSVHKKQLIRERLYLCPSSGNLATQAPEIALRIALDGWQLYQLGAPRQETIK